ncbi:MAG: guanosine-5'-triphosphate,3'-diphosphate pyrophosphatase [Idiomarina sp.]|nr:guanosine-5'-triphosphate,3'-diphosphate pyrophosphatase [Idiomarina sp.]
MRSTEYYAAIDLGSNSFHMLVVRVVAGSVQIVSKIRRKVRLAAGLLPNGELSEDAQLRALECLAIFADRVCDIAPENIRAVGTAALRKISNSDSFLRAIEHTLGHPIRIISGEEEAATIYQGIAHTTATKGALLVCDIGGASTELALGHGFESSELRSLDMGCVTWMTKFFPDGKLSPAAAESAIQAAMHLVEPHKSLFQVSPDASILGASGTFKALQDIARHQRRSESFTLAWLESLLKEVVTFEHLEAIQLPGLKPERLLVFLPGLCILIALFRVLKLPRIEATEAALREGLVYGMLKELQHDDVQLRTLESLAAHYHADLSQTTRVLQIQRRFLNELSAGIALPSDTDMLSRAVAYLHEIGLSLSYKQASKHSRYLLKHSNLPGFSQQQRSELLRLLEAVTGIIDDDQAPETLPSHAPLALLSRILRVSILCCQRRRDDAVPECQLEVLGSAPEQLRLILPSGFLRSNPYLGNLLNEESLFQAPFGGLELIDR